MSTKLSCAAPSSSPPTGRPVTFSAVADITGFSRATLYRNENLRAIVDEHRARQRDARTLTGLNTEIATCGQPLKRSPSQSSATKNTFAASTEIGLNSDPNRTSPGSD